MNGAKKYFQHRMLSGVPRIIARHWWGALCSAVGFLALALPNSSSAEESLTNVTYDEFKLGILAHDVRFLGGREQGIDINPELIFQSPVGNEWASTVPEYLRWLVQPRPTFGGEINTAGSTSQMYFG